MSDMFPFKNSHALENAKQLCRKRIHCDIFYNINNALTPCSFVCRYYTGSASDNWFAPCCPQWIRTHRYLFSRKSCWTVSRCPHYALKFVKLGTQRTCKRSCSAPKKRLCLRVLMWSYAGSQKRIRIRTLTFHAMITWGVCVCYCDDWILGLTCWSTENYYYKWGTDSNRISSQPTPSKSFLRCALTNQRWHIAEQLYVINPCNDDKQVDCE